MTGDEQCRSQPLRRPTPRDIACVALSLASDDASCLTGTSSTAPATGPFSPRWAAPSGCGPSVPAPSATAPSPACAPTIPGPGVRTAFTQILVMLRVPSGPDAGRMTRRYAVAVIDDSARGDARGRAWPGAPRLAMAKFRPTTLPGILVTRPLPHDRLTAGSARRTRRELASGPRSLTAWESLCLAEWDKEHRRRMGPVGHPGPASDGQAG